jgi:SAM-dependent methyltransferase
MLRRRFAAPRVNVLEADAATAVATGRWDAVVAVNVLEHIERDEAMLRVTADHLKPEGRVLLFVPAFEALSSEFDRAIGHHRRYRREELILKLYRAGFTVERCEYVNRPGFLAWLLYARLLGRVPTSTGAVSTYDRLVPAVRWAVEHLSGRLRFGQSVVAVARVA